MAGDISPDMEWSPKWPREGMEIKCLPALAVQDARELAPCGILTALPLIIGEFPQLENGQCKGRCEEQILEKGDTVRDRRVKWQSNLIHPMATLPTVNLLFIYICRSFTG